MFRSGGGGLHRLFLYPVGDRIRKQTNALKKFFKLTDPKAKTGIDVLSDGGQALLPPSRHINGNTYEWVNHPDDVPPVHLPVEWVNALNDRESGSVQIALGSEDSEEGYDIEALLSLSSTSPLEDINLELAGHVLSFVMADCDYSEWMRIGQALHHQFPDEPLDALELFDRWSMTAPDRYPGRKTIDQHWDSYGKRDDLAPVTFRSVLKQAKDNGYKPAGPVKTGPEMARDERQRLREEDATRLAAFLLRLRRANTDMDLADIAADLRSTELFDASRGALIDAYQAAYERLHPGKKLSKVTAKELLSDAGEREERLRNQADEEGWFKPYVYCEEDKLGGFWNIDLGGIITTKVFNDVYSSRLVTPISRAQGKVSPIFLPVDLVLNCDLVPKVRGVRYAPGQPQIYQEDAITYVNAYRPPPEGTDPMLFSPEEEEAVKLVDSHLTWLLGEERATLLKQFLGYIVQNPTKRVRWCYLIIGPKGNGKTFVSQMMRGILGPFNAKDVGPASLGHTSFNGWAEGAQLTSIEELKVDGVRKWEIMNSMKAVITNDYIDVHKKGVNPYTARNTTSLIAFTNFENAVAVTEGDRRWYITNTRFISRSAFLADLGGADASARYFTRLFRAAEEHPDALRGWLQAVPLDSFDPTQAPDTSEKEDLAELSKSDEEHTMQRVIAGSSNPYVKPHVLSINAFRAMMTLEEDTREMSGQRLARQLREAGWRPVLPMPLKIDEGEQSRWYYHAEELAKRKLPLPPKVGATYWIKKALES